MKQNANFETVQSILTEVRAEVANGKTMADLEAYGVRIDTLTEDWSLMDRVALSEEISEIFSLSPAEREHVAAQARQEESTAIAEELRRV